MAEQRDILWRFLGDAKNLNRASGDATRSLGGVEKGMASAAKVAGALGLALGAREIIGFAGDAVQMAVAAEEVDSKFKAVYGSAFGFTQALSKWADMAGITDTAAKDLAATFGNLAMAQGISADDTEDLALSVSTLAGDMASFNDADPAAVFEDLNKAILTTEREGMKKYGIAVTENEVKTRALAIATAAGRKEVTQADRSLAAYNIILDQSGKANGDLERTQDSLANQQRRLKAEFKETQEEIGRELLPAYRSLIKAANDLAPALKAAARATSGYVSDNLAFVDGLSRASEEGSGLNERLRGMSDAVNDWGLAVLRTNPATWGLVTAVDNLTTSTERMTGGANRLKDRFDTFPYREFSAGMRGVEDAVDGVDDSMTGLVTHINGVITAWGRWVQAVNSSKFDRDKLEAGRDPGRRVSGGNQRQEFASGGIVAGPRGTEQSIVAHAGERVVPLGSDSGGGANITINIGVAGDPYQTARQIADLLRRYETANGTRISGVSQ